MSKKEVQHHHINSSEVKIKFIGRRRKNKLPAKQVLLSFEEDYGIIELPGVKLLNSYRENSVMMTYDMFRKFIFKSVKLLNEMGDVSTGNMLGDGDAESVTAEEDDPLFTIIH